MAVYQRLPRVSMTRMVVPVVLSTTMVDIAAVTFTLHLRVDSAREVGGSHKVRHPYVHRVLGP